MSIRHLQLYNVIVVSPFLLGHWDVIIVDCRASLAECEIRPYCIEIMFMCKHSIHTVLGYSYLEQVHNGMIR